MILWKMRHQGSPQSLDRMTAEQIVEGVQEGQWDPTDEVLGPHDTAWQSLEMHPHFAEAMADIDPPVAPPPPDETRLDMNPLIDVALVLLIFFILTTTYEELRKMFPAPPGTQDEVKQTIGDGALREITIRVTAEQENGQTVIRVENEPTPETDLKQRFIDWKKKTGHSKLAVEMDKLVPWKTFMAIQDAAAGADIQETIRIERRAPKEE